MCSLVPVLFIELLRWFGGGRRYSWDESTVTTVYLEKPIQVIGTSPVPSENLIEPFFWSVFAITITLQLSHYKATASTNTNTNTGRGMAVRLSIDWPRGIET